VYIGPTASVTMSVVGWVNGPLSVSKTFLVLSFTSSPAIADNPCGA